MGQIISSGITAAANVATSAATNATNYAIASDTNQTSQAIAQQNNQTAIDIANQNNRTSIDLQREAQEFNASEAEKQRDWSSAPNQVKLMQEAGLNPNGANFSQAGSSASSPSVPSLQQPNLQNPNLVTPTMDFNVSDAVDDAIKISKLHDEKDKLQAEARQTNADAKLKELESEARPSILSANLQEVMTRISKIKADKELLEENKKYIGVISKNAYNNGINDMIKTGMTVFSTEADINIKNNNTEMMRAELVKYSSDYSQRERFYVSQFRKGVLDSSYQYGSSSDLSNTGMSSSSHGTSMSELSENILSSGGTISGSLGYPELGFGAHVGGNINSSDKSSINSGETFNSGSSQSFNETSHGERNYNQQYIDSAAKALAPYVILSDPNSTKKEIEYAYKALKRYEPEFDHFKVLFNSFKGLYDTNQSYTPSLPE